MALNSFAYLVGCCLAITSSTLGWWPLWDWSSGNQTELAYAYAFGGSDPPAPPSPETQTSSTSVRAHRGQARQPRSREADTSGRLEAAKPGRQEATKPENPLPSPTSPRLETCGPAEHNASASAVLRLPASPLLHEAQKKNASFLCERLAAAVRKQSEQGL